MNEDNGFGSGGSDNIAAPVLDDIEYDAPSTKKDGPQGVSAPVLDDMDYVAPTAKKGGPQGVSAPVLDDFDDYIPKNHEKKGAPENVTAPVLDDNSYTAPNAESEDAEIIAALTPEQKTMYDRLPPEKQRQVLDMRKAQLAQQKAAQESAPVRPLVPDNEDSYTPTPKEEKKPEEPVKAPILDDEPEPPKYVPKYVDEDLERAKKEGAKRSVSSQLVSNQKDEKESLRMMLELKAEREAEAAKKGFKITLLLAFLGVAAGTLFFLLYSCNFFGLSYSDSGNKFYDIMTQYSLYIGAAAGVCSLALITGVNGLKSLCSFVYLIFSVVQIIGLFAIMPQINGSAAAKWGMCIGALVCSAAVFVTLSASEAVGLFFKKPSKDYR